MLGHGYSWKHSCICVSRVHKTDVPNHLCKEDRGCVIQEKSLASCYHTTSRPLEALYLTGTTLVCETIGVD